MKTPLVSVIIPYYKKLNFFKQTYFSVIKQSYKNLEIIIIYDDPSKFDLETLKKIINKKNTKIIVNNNNLGVGKSRNIGISVSKGSYIAFIDSDDIWHKHKIKDQIKFMLKNHFCFTHTSYLIIDKKNNIIGNRKAREKILYNELLHSCDIGLSTVVLEKKCLGNLKFPNIKTKEDFVLWLNLSKKIPIIGINKTLTKWRKLDNSLSSNTLQKIKDGFKVYNKYMNFNLIKSLFYLLSLSLNFLTKNNLK